MDPITQALQSDYIRKLLAQSQLGAPATGTLPPDPAYGPSGARPSMGGYVAAPMPALPTAPPMKPAAPVNVPRSAPPTAPMPTGLLSAPPSPGAAPPVGAPQPVSPLFGAPQPVSPLVNGGNLPQLPGAEPEGGGFLDFLAKPEIARSLMEMGARMLAASAPSTDPRSGSLGFALGQGVGGFTEGMDTVREQQRQERNDAVNEAYKLAIAAGDGGVDLQKFYDDQGREVMGYWDAGQGRMIQVGGAKAPTGRGGGAGGSGGAGGASGPGGGTGMYKGREEQNKAIAFGSYIDRALPTIEAVTKTGEQPDWFQRMAAENLPFGLGNFALDDNARSFMQAEREIAAAVLRRETGAAFSDDEMRDVRARYIPQPGDDQATIDQKMRALNEIKRSYWIQSGLPEDQWRVYSGIDPNAAVRQPSPGGVTPPAGSGPGVDAGAYPEGSVYDGAEGRFIVQDGEWVEAD